MCVCAPQQGIPPLQVWVIHPSGGVRVLRERGKTADPANKAPGGSAECCCSHGNQAGKRQATEFKEETI